MRMDTGRKGRRRRAEDYAVAVCMMHERHAMKMKICVYGRGGMTNWMTDRLCRAGDGYTATEGAMTTLCPALTEAPITRVAQAPLASAAPTARRSGSPSSVTGPTLSRHTSVGLAGLICETGRGPGSPQLNLCWP